MHRNTLIPIWQNVVRDITSFNKLDVSTPLQALEANKRFVFTNTDFKSRVKTCINISIHYRSTPACKLFLKAVIVLAKQSPLNIWTESTGQPSVISIVKASYSIKAAGTCITAIANIISPLAKTTIVVLNQAAKFD